MDSRFVPLLEATIKSMSLSAMEKNEGNLVEKCNEQVQLSDEVIAKIEKYLAETQSPAVRLCFPRLKVTKSTLNVTTTLQAHRMSRSFKRSVDNWLS
jgi:hypothetical protein